MINEIIIVQFISINLYLFDMCIHFKYIKYYDDNFTIIKRSNKTIIYFVLLDNVLIKSV